MASKRKVYIQGPIITVVPKEIKTVAFILNKLVSCWNGNGAMANVPNKVLIGPNNLSIKKIYREWVKCHKKDATIDKFANHLIKYHSCCELKFKSHSIRNRKMDRDINLW